jgi:hypothetical protein
LAAGQEGSWVFHILKAEEQPFNRCIKYCSVKTRNIFVTLTVDWWVTAINNLQKFGTFCNHGLMA